MMAVDGYVVCSRYEQYIDVLVLQADGTLTLTKESKEKGGIDVTDGTGTTHFMVGNTIWGLMVRDGCIVRNKWDAKMKGDIRAYKITKPN
jgi:hypothetical protein